MGAKAVSSSKVERNARITVNAAMVLAVLFAIEVVAVVIKPRSVLTLHVVVGLLLVPPLLVKLGSVTWRMVGYYRGDADFKRRGRPDADIARAGPAADARDGGGAHERDCPSTLARSLRRKHAAHSLDQLLSLADLRGRACRTARQGHSTYRPAGLGPCVEESGARPSSGRCCWWRASPAGAALVEQPAKARRTSLISVIPTDEGDTSAGTATVARLRSALSGLTGGVEVGGNTAQNVDFNSAVYGNFPLMLAAIAVLTFLLLARTFRSVVLAVKAVLVNLVSLGASFGFLVLFWQHGYGSHFVYGVSATGSIRNWIPIVSFAFLFGLSMDYEVFILARMREEYDRTGSTREAVVNALARTGRLVTCTAVILTISFAFLSSAPDIVVEMIASGLGIGILVDAVIVRTLLVPALVAIMGRWNWWMPNTLATILRIPRTSAPSALDDTGTHERVNA